MGVKGLWCILESARRKVDLELLRGKRMAIDMNIWLHQALKSKAKGNHNIHLAILYRRICKLLFYGIRPVFVFDGAVPMLKRDTVAKRRTCRSTAQESSLRARNTLLKRLFRRLAENGVKSMKPNNELTAEFVNRYISTEGMRRAEIDEEIFGSQNTALVAPPPSSSILHLESEQQSALQLAKDFIASSSSIDIYSDAFNALPTQAQLQVILILQDASLDVSSGVSGETFSQAQVKRLVMRRKLSRKKKEIEARMNESLIAKEVPKEMQSTPDMTVMALRIASQDEGHAILLKRRTSKEKADDLKKRLNRILAGTPAPASGSNDDAKSDSSPLKKFTSESRTATKRHKTDRESVDHDDEVKVRNEAQDSEAASSDTDDLIDVEEGSVDLKTLDALALRLIQSREVEASSSVNTSSDLSVKPGDVEFRKSDEESSSLESSFDDTEFVDVIDQSVSTENSTDIKSNVNQSTSPENSQDFTDNLQLSPVEKSSNVESFINKLDTKIADERKFLESEAEDGLSREEALPQISTFLTSGFDDADDDLEIDDAVLRSEADRFERLAQETTSDCVAEAQRLVELFGFPVITSPEEAEAQCCRLQQLGLVDVVASDDSDVWVFGASLVCRHLFGSDSGKAKSQPATSLYSSQDIKERLGLERRHLIQLAMLCGSDYTNGIDKVGPIKAMEIVAFFDHSHKYPDNTEMDAVLRPLEEFRELCRGGTDKSETVVRGYLSPNVEEPSEFQWNTPQMALLTKYAMEKLGWSRQTSEGMLTSVLSKFNATLERGVNRTPLITEFFPRIETKSMYASRLTQATDKLKYAKEFENLPDLDDWSADEEDSGAKPLKKRKSTEESKTNTKRRRRKA